MGGTVYRRWVARSTGAAGRPWRSRKTTACLCQIVPPNRRFCEPRAQATGGHGQPPAGPPRSRLGLGFVATGLRTVI